MIYRPVIVAGEVVDWALKGDLPYGVIVIDEGSMVNAELWKHLMSYGIPIIAIGDHGQLPPIGKQNFNLMEDPDQILEEIHRQALDNPIIKLSMMARNGQYIKPGNYGHAAKFTAYDSKRFLSMLKVDPDTICLCGINKTRVRINEMLRENHGFTRKQPYPDEKVICLKNNRELGIMNGMTGYIRKLVVTSDNTYELTVDVDGGYRIRTITYANIFGKVKYDTAFEDANHPKVRRVLREHKQKYADLFDYGYCISVHKSQGSEWERVVLFDERNYYQSDDDYARWLYTGITRARNKLLIIEED
jgi:exodeoxyribonuclease-5